ncbi:MAG TPA: BON domain-containing protein [Pirellulales bacterium]|nr:BON domain-containing protein [Pirellulales bacterium]
MTGTLQPSHTRWHDNPGCDRQGRHDEELRRRVVNDLVQRGIPELESVRLTVSQGTVLLWGDVGSPTAKWRCYQCCQYVAGVIHVIDRLVVVGAGSKGFSPRH